MNVKLSEHPILQRIAQYINIQVYDRDGGTSSPRIRLELRTKGMDAALLEEVMAVQTPCVRCGDPVSPFRKRATRKGGAGRVAGLQGHIYIAIACPLKNNYGCCRGSEADHEYVAIRERVCKILGIDPLSYSTKHTVSGSRSRSRKTSNENSQGDDPPTFSISKASQCNGCMHRPAGLSSEPCSRCKRNPVLMIQGVGTDLYVAEPAGSSTGEEKPQASGDPERSCDVLEDNGPSAQEVEIAELKRETEKREQERNNFETCWKEAEQRVVFKMDEIARLESRIRKLDAFLETYDAWALSDEIPCGPLFDKMVATRVALTHNFDHTDFSDSPVEQPPAKSQEDWTTQQLRNPGVRAGFEAAAKSCEKCEPLPASTAPCSECGNVGPHKMSCGVGCGLRKPAAEPAILDMSPDVDGVVDAVVRIMKAKPAAEPVGWISTHWHGAPHGEVQVETTAHGEWTTPIFLHPLRLPAAVKRVVKVSRDVAAELESGISFDSPLADELKAALRALDADVHPVINTATGSENDRTAEEKPWVDCRFCGKTPDKAKRMIQAKDGTTICDHCVDLAWDLVHNKTPVPAASEKPQSQPKASPRISFHVDFDGDPTASIGSLTLHAEGLDLHTLQELAIGLQSKEHTCS